MNNTDDWDKPREFLGHAVENGHINYLSVSAVEKAAPRAGGCFRRWFYRYVLGDKEPEKEASKVAKKKGTLMHGRLSHFMLTGEMVLQAPEVNGIHMLPKPGPDLWVEQPFHCVSPGVDDKHPVITSSLHAAGIPFVGIIDLAHGRLETWTEDDGRVIDPPGTVEVIDHKFKSNAKDRQGNFTYKMPGELVQTVQMAGYGVVVANTQPAATHVRLSHLYYPERGDRPRKVTRLHVLEDCVRSWEYVNGVARTLVDVARETDVNRVDGNVQACDAMGGCPYRDKCSKYQTTSIDNLFGKIAADFHKEPAVGILSNNPNLMIPSNPMQPQPDMRAQLAQEEAALKAQQIQQQAMMPGPAQVQPNLLEATSKLQGFGRGFPNLAGAAAMAYAAAGGQSIAPGSTYSGFGELARVTLSDPAHIFQLVGDLEQQARNAQQPPLQPPAPQVQQVAQNLVQAQPAPTTYATPQQQNFTQQLATAYNAVVTAAAPQHTFVASGGNSAGGLLAPGTPESQPQLAMQQPTPQVQAPAESSKKGRGRPKKSDENKAPEISGVAPEQIADVQAVPPTPAASTPSQVAPVQSSVSPVEKVIDEVGTSTILVNARFEGKNTKSLAGYVDFINEKLARKYNTTSDGQQGPLDVRMAVPGSNLGFGGWKGGVREAVKAEPPPAGLYHFDTHMCELNEIVADALREVAAAKGWIFIRGIR